MEALGNDTVNVVFDKAPKTAAVGEVVPLTVKFHQRYWIIMNSRLIQD